MSEVYYETGRSNSGDYERFTTKRAAMREAQKIADEFQETVFVDKRTEEDPIDYFRVEPKRNRRERDRNS